MSAASRRLKAGAYATTDFNGPGPRTRVLITARIESRSQSGVSFRVTPALRNTTSDAWIDADWFEVERCHADRDGDCKHATCPQLRDGEPAATGRHCPLDVDED